MYKKLIISLFCIFIMTACSSNLKKKETSYSTIEYQNLLNDYMLYGSETASIFKELDKDDLTINTLTIFLAQSLENYYVIASNRLSEDLDNLSLHSEKYIDYLGYTQAYVNLYLKDVSIIKKAIKTGDIDSILNTDFYKQTMVVADSSIQFAKDVQETQSKEKS